MVDSAIVGSRQYLEGTSQADALGAAAATEIAFIDPAVSDVRVLLAGLSPDVQPIMLNAAEPAPRQIAAALSGRAGLDAIHIIAHGAPGEVRFAAGVLSANSVNEHAADLAALGAALGQNASLMCGPARPVRANAARISSRRWRPRQAGRLPRPGALSALLHAAAAGNWTPSAPLRRCVRR